jgi:TonB family protein
VPVFGVPTAIASEAAAASPATAARHAARHIAPGSIQPVVAAAAPNASLAAVPQPDLPNPVAAADAPSSGVGADPPSPGAAAEPPAGVAGTQAAMASPTEASTDPALLRPLRHDPPKISVQAALSGIVEGHARVRLWVTPEGKVDQIDIVEAAPQGVVDDEVRRTLSLWTFEPPGRSTDKIVELTLKP